MAHTVHRIDNFGAGPSAIPLEVLEEVQKDLLNIHGSGMSIMEISHRGKIFDGIIKETEEDLRKLLSIPSNYRVLFLQGGGTGQFAGVPLNLLGNTGVAPSYIITGQWSHQASEEAKIFCHPHLACTGLVTKNGISGIPHFNIPEKASYLYYCDNETIHGVEFPKIPSVPEGIPIVVDMSSNFLTRPFDVKNFGAIFAGAQKNCGMAGITIVIVRDDLLSTVKTHPVPSILNWKINSDNNSRLNTPPTTAIYVAGLVFKWILKEGGLTAMAERVQVKSDMLYNIIDNSNGFYQSMIDKDCRSRVNVVFRINPESLQSAFLKEAMSLGMDGLAGHRSVGGIRISLYNAVTVDQVKKLVSFMDLFKSNNTQK